MKGRYAGASMKKPLGPQTILHPSPVVVVGTYGPDGRPNAMTASWVAICCSQPPCVSLALRRATYTHGNLLTRRAFTLNIPSASQVRLVDYFGLVSGRDVDKLAVSGLTAVQSLLVDAPRMEEFPLVLECQLCQSLELGSHTLFVGEIVEVLADETILDAQGRTDPERLRPLAFAFEQQGYYAMGPFVARAFALGQEVLLKVRDPHVA